MAAAVAFVLVAFSWADRLEIIFSLIGAVFAPAIGTIVADAWRQKGQWRGIRMGLNPCGVIAWGAGLFVGVIPLLGALFQWPLAQDFAARGAACVLHGRGRLPGFGRGWPGAAAGRAA